MNANEREWKFVDGNLHPHEKKSKIKEQRSKVEDPGVFTLCFLLFALCSGD